MKYIYCLIFCIININTSIGQFVGDPWKDGTWKYPVHISDNIYRFNAYHLHYDLRNVSSSQAKTMPIRIR
jgi:hypothetical protein